MLGARLRMVAVTDSFSGSGDWLSIALPRPAAACYRLFCDVERTPEWLPVLASAVVTERDRHGRARTVAYQARLERAGVGYSCRYSYVPDGHQIAWSTPNAASIAVRGVAQFQALAPASCLMTYALDLRISVDLPAFADPTFALHASSAALADFRDFARRALP
jgi:uncharacterized membrane protein